MCKPSDYEIELLWQELEDVLVDENDCLCGDWRDWKKGTHREEIWQWFDKYHSRGVGWLMNDYDADETKTLRFNVWCQALYEGRLAVPSSMTLEEAIEYAKYNLVDVEPGQLEHVLSDDEEIDDFSCEFEED